MSQDRVERRRFNIFVSILVFVATVVLLTASAITAANLLQARNDASTVASDSLDLLVHQINREVTSFFGSAELLVELYAISPRVHSAPEEIALLQPTLFRSLERNPQISGIYAGYENGDFWEAFRFAEADRALVELVGGPPATRFAFQSTTFDERAKTRVERWRFFDAESQEIGTKEDPPTYDPRTRDWYTKACAEPGTLVHAAPYMFAANSRAGLTLAQSFDQSRQGVVGTDVTLSTFTQFLNSIRPGPSHEILLLGEDGELLAAASDDPALPVRQPSIFASENPLIRSMADRFVASGPFTVETFDVGGTTYLGSIAPLISTTSPSRRELVLAAAPRDVFEGALAGATERSLLAALAVLLVVSPAVGYFARRVAQPLRELADNAKLIEAILDTVPNPLFYKDAEARFIGCNSAYEATFGTSRKAIAGRRVLDLEYLPLEDRTAYQAQDEQIIASGGSDRYEVPMDFADGARHDTLYQVSGFRLADGAPGGLVGTFVDISQIKQMQQALSVAKEQAEAATRAKSEFLASISHEIRTPLNGVTGMADLLAQSKLTDDQRYTLQTIRESGSSLLRVINDILDFSKTEAGKLEIEQVPMSVADALEGVAITLTPGATAKGLFIHPYVDPKIPQSVLGDPVRLRQILFNLTGNAVKFSNNHDVEVRALCANRDDGVCKIRFEVIDNGIGISEENQKKLFQAFNQAESSTTRRYGGTGLGLAISKRLSDLMHGDIGVTSRPGQGSTFCLELDFPETQIEVPPERALDQLKILVVAGLPSRLTAIEGYLQYWGATVQNVPDTAAALELLRSNKTSPFNVAILDFGFDRDDQAAAIRSLRAEELAACVPLVALKDIHKMSKALEDGNLVTLDANPLVRHRLVTAVAIAVGRASPDVRQAEGEEQEVPAAKAPTVEEARARGHLILVAEDNATNQEVIRRQLDRLGYACEIVGNGAEALRAWRAGRYGVILTDCHCPRWTATSSRARSVKSRRRPTGHTPVIAVTANALQGEADRCLQAGMDDCLTKPLAMHALRAALQKWMPGAQSDGTGDLQESASTSTRAALPPTEDIVIDESVIKEMFGDDENMFREILTAFAVPSRHLSVAMADAVKSRNAETVKDIAHQLKSSARTIGASRLADIYMTLEAAGKNSHWAEIDDLAPQAEVQMARVLDRIASIVDPSI